MSESKSFIGACKDFFGYKPGETLKEFAEEVKQLTPQDRDEIKAELIKAGYSIKENS